MVSMWTNYGILLLTDKKRKEKMKKLLIFALLLIPVTSFAASSVRVLGSGSGSPSSTTKPSAKVVPTKATAAKPAAANVAA